MGAVSCGVSHRHVRAEEGELVVAESARRLVEHAAAQTTHEVQRRFVRDVVVGERAAVLELLAGKDQALLVGRDALLVLGEVRGEQ